MLKSSCNAAGDGTSADSFSDTNFPHSRSM